jgi:hypothetical protein
VNTPKPVGVVAILAACRPAAHPTKIREIPDILRNHNSVNFFVQRATVRCRVKNENYGWNCAPRPQVSRTRSS